MRFSYVLLGIILVCATALGQGVSVPLTRTPAPPRQGQLVLQLKDDSGLPISGAVLALQAEWMDENAPNKGSSQVSLRTYVRGGAVRTPVSSNGNGELAVPASQVFTARQLDTIPTSLFVIDQARRLGAFVDVHTTDVGTPVPVTLQPLCFVHAKVQSADMEGAGHLMSRVGASIMPPGSLGARVKSVSENGRVGMLLPPGSYQLTVGGVATDGATYAPLSQSLDIPAGQTDLDLETLDLASSEMSNLLGKPAPDLKGIVEWRNGSPVTLEKLRGKVVVLDFWAFSCSICLGEMPALFQIQRQYANDPDLVIIAIHAPNATTLDEAYEKFAAVRERLWHGADFPFRVALDSPGGTYAAFGVHGIPNTLVIGRDGVLARRFYAITKSDFKQELDRLLGTSVTAVDSRSIFSDEPKPGSTETSAAPVVKEAAPTRVQVLGMRLQRHLPDDRKGLIPDGRSGVVLQLMVSAVDQTIVGVDESASTVGTFSDDQGTELRRYDEGDFWEGPFTREAKVSEDHHSAAVEIASSAEPGVDATKLLLKGSLMVKVAGPERTQESKPVLLQAGSAFEVGPYSMKIDEIKTAGLRDNMKVGMTLNFDGDADPIRSMKFFDPIDREIHIETISSSVSQGHTTKELELSEKPKTISVRMAYYSKIDRVKVPLDVQVGIGL